MSTFCRNVTETTPFQFSRASERRRLLWLLPPCHESPRLTFAQHGPGFARFSSLSTHYKYDALAPANFAKFIKLHLLQLLILQSSSSFQAFVSYIFSYFNGKEGVESVSMDMKEKKLTVVGHVGIINMVKQLRKLCHTDLVLVGSPVEAAENKEGPKEPKKPKAKKDSKDASYGNPGYATFDHYDPVSGLVWYHFHNSMETKKIILKLEVFDDKAKQKAMRNVSCLLGVTSISVDMKDKKLTVIGDVDPVCIVSKLRKFCRTEILSVGPAKEPEKKKEPKKEEPKKEEKGLKINGLILLKHAKPIALAMPTLLLY
ncbi:Heavy metal-associated isoprenylated plant protein 39 [Vitis vinifera]|uniref:Heavy metal-associated isoprenylated plant protein 39 n=1 Tax=Vitis vinifera TaxID=29760 RepID=A0A438IZ90_VITVI|nr:Heavy metal-associated isoprenylated plant protein 39 [Vitis vinifera]